MKIFDQQSDRAERKVAAEDGPDLLGLFLDDDELLGDAPVTERHGSADPETLPFGGGNLVSDTLADHLSFELGEGQKHIEGEPPHAARGVEGLRD
jgi:hypothetical protein